MKCECTSKQPTYIIETIDDDKCRISLYTNEQTASSDEGTIYIYDLYTVVITNRPNLTDNISGNYDAWVEFARAEENARKEREMIAKLDKSRVSDIESAVIELADMIAAQDDALVELASLIV